MQLALIPPSSMDSSLMETTFNLLLPWQLTDPTDSVREALTTNYTVLDNGAAEDRLVSWQQLLNLCDQHEGLIDEVVIPDKLKDADFTIENARQAAELAKPLLERGIKLMAVAQGMSLAEVMKCVYAYAGWEHISVIALPRVLNTQFLRDSRRRLAESLANDKDLCDIPIHCLGSTYDNPREMAELKHLPNVRSMDTSLPFVWGIQTRHITGQYPRAGLSRPDDYFDYQVTPAQRSYCNDNIIQCLQWAKTFGG